MMLARTARKLMLKQQSLDFQDGVRLLKNTRCRKSRTNCINVMSDEELAEFRRKGKLSIRPRNAPASKKARLARFLAQNTKAELIAWKISRNPPKKRKTVKQLISQKYRLNNRFLLPKRMTLRKLWLKTKRVCKPIGRKVLQLMKGEKITTKSVVGVGSCKPMSRIREN